MLYSKAIVPMVPDFHYSRFYGFCFDLSRNAVKQSARLGVLLNGPSV
jgi:hypothetical protein